MPLAELFNITSRESETLIRSGLAVCDLVDVEDLDWSVIARIQITSIMEEYWNVSALFEDGTSAIVGSFIDDSRAAQFAHRLSAEYDAPVQPRIVAALRPRRRGGDLEGVAA